MSKFAAFVPEKEQREFPAMKAWLASFVDMYERNHHPDSKVETLDVNDIERLIVLASSGLGGRGAWTRCHECGAFGRDAVFPSPKR
jgi:hypothetical protein